MQKIHGEHSTDHRFLFPRVKLWEVISNNHYNRPLQRCLPPINYKAHSGWQVLWTFVLLGDHCHSRNSLYVSSWDNTCEYEAIPSRIPREDLQPNVSRFYFHSSTASSFFANYLLWKNALNISIFMSGLVNLSQSTRYYVLIDITTCTWYTIVIRIHEKIP